MEESPMPVPAARSVSTSRIITHRPITTLLILQGLLHVRVVRRIRAWNRNDGQDSGLLQTPGLRVPELGDLRRYTLLLRLRTLRRRAEKKHKRGVGATHGTHARRRRRYRDRDYHAPEGVGSLRTRRGLQRHARREPYLRTSLPGRPSHRGSHGDGG